MKFSPGALVRAREREWVVLPESEEDFLYLRPLGGTLEETAGVHTALEEVVPAAFPPPSTRDLGDYFSCRLLRDACRFGFRSSAGPFRSFGRLAVQPRPYQLVPLLMALKLDPVRLLIADDVGIGKTIEACLVAREMLDRGEITRLCVLCPPHLAEQWQSELASKFNIHAELVLTGTARRLERGLSAGQYIFDVYPFVIVSTDFIKSDRRRHDFLRTCPEFVIVDEAHTCAASAEGRGTAHQRFELVSALSAVKDRHVVLVTATPHSGNEGAFRSLLSILDPDFSELPENLSGDEKSSIRRRLAAHLVQRRRADIRHFLQADTPFPDREDGEVSYDLSPGYKALFRKVLDYARETVADQTGTAFQRRIRWWSALSLLRAMASSPAAAAATLRARSRSLEAPDVETADEIGRKAVLDVQDDIDSEAEDAVAGSDAEASEGESPARRRLLAFAREADKLKGAGDAKLAKVADIVRKLVTDGYRPIVFCRFIQTVEYLAEELRGLLPKTVDITAITSLLAPAERQVRIEAIPANPAQPHVLVCTDCLSEGINLQEKYDAVVHYDLSWNPTRHEQRDGRIDRFGQKRSVVRVVTMYGRDNQIDGIVLEVLLRKHKAIRDQLGISVPMPVNTEQIVEAVFEGILLRAAGGEKEEQLLPTFEEYFKPQKAALQEQWQSAADREKRSRTVFAQESIKFSEVADELAECERAIGSPTELADFFRNAVAAHGGRFVRNNGATEFNLAEAPAAIREACGGEVSFKAGFDPAAAGYARHLHRTHPWVEAVAGHVMNAALDAATDSPARRAGVVRVKAVASRTVLLLLRLRFQIVTAARGAARHLLAEDSLLAAFDGDPACPRWLETAQAEKLLTLVPDANVPSDAAAHHLRTVAEEKVIAALRPHLDRMVAERGETLLAAHRRVRQAAGGRGSYRVEPSPADILGLYVFLPVPKGA
jgi:ERCC4-related helicase